MEVQNSVSMTPINIGSLDDLKRQEAKIVRRINRTANGGRLFLADPIRLLKEINVNLSGPAQRALEEALGVEALATNPLRSLYDDFRRDMPDQAVTVVIRGILP